MATTSTVGRALLACGLLFGLLGCDGRYIENRHGTGESEPPPGLFGAPEGEIEQKPVRAGDRIETGGTTEPGSRPPEEAEFYAGSGRFVRAKPGEARVENHNGEFTLNFAGADVRRVLEAVLGEMLERAYAVAPEIEGTITARTARPLSRKDLLPALEDVLAMNGIALVDSGEMIRVVPLEAVKTAAPVLVGPRGRNRGYGIHIIPVDFVSADALVDSLSTFVTPGRSLQADSARNLLLFRGPGVEARNITDMVRLFDVDWMDGMSFALLPLSHADVSTVVGELDIIFGQGGEAPQAMQGVVRFVPVERMNAVLVVSEQPAYVYRAEEWVKRLDRGGGSEDERQLYVFHLRQARASDVARVLGELFDVRTVGPSQTGNGGSDIALGRQSGTVSSDGAGQSGSGGAAGSAGRSGSGSQASAARQIQTPGDVRSRGSGGRGGGGLLGAAAGGGPRIIADERNDAMLVLATAREYRMIESTIERLDITPLQVLIEATIAEVTLNDTLRYGLRYFFDASGSGNINELTFSDFANGAVATEFPGFSYFFDSGDAQVALSALDEITDVTVVSSPQLMVLDNQTARLQVGDQVPVPVQQSVATQDPSAPIVNSIQFEDTGVILEVTPHVNASGLVVIDVNQEVSDVVQTTSSGIDAPTIQQRQIASSVAVQTGETIALGGLIRDSRTEIDSGIPLLMNIPWLGNLFKTQATINERTELLVLLTPKVVRDPAESRAVTQELRRRLKGLERIRRNFGLEPSEPGGALPLDETDKDSAPADDGAPQASAAAAETAEEGGS